MAKSPELYTDAGDPDKLPQMVERIVEDAANVPSIAELMLTNNLPPMLEYVAGSADVPPEAVSTQPSGTQLTWRWDRSGVARPLTVTYHVRPIAEGTGTITGTLTISQTDGVRTGVDFASNPLSSTGPCVTPSAEPTASRTPAPSPTPTPPPTLAPSDTPRPSPVPPRPPLFLPIALHERCLPDVRRVDVVLAIDASSSMTEPASGGRTKLAVALDAARVFLDQLHFERGDQAAVVAFNAGATLRVPLVSDQGRLAEALHDIQTAEQTCLACAVEVAAGELAGPRHVAGHTAAIVLLTDGRSNPRPASDAVERARATKAAGVVIFSIGLGSDLDDAALGEMASRRAYFYHAPQAEDLADIYRQIAVDLPCAGEPAGPRQ